MNKKDPKPSQQENISTLNIYQKLQLVQQQVGELEKDKTNISQNYKYVEEYDIFRTIRPLLNANNLVLTFSDEVHLISETTVLPIIQAEKLEKFWIVKYLKKMTLINADNLSEQLTYHFWACGQNNDIAKAKGSAETYAIKYFLLKFFLIPTNENLDPDKQPSDDDATPKEKVNPPSSKTITPEQTKELTNLLKTKRENNQSAQIDFLKHFDKIMSGYGVTGATNNFNFNSRLTMLTLTDYQLLMDYLDGLENGK